MAVVEWMIANWRDILFIFLMLSIVAELRGIRQAVIQVTERVGWQAQYTRTLSEFERGLL